MRVEALRLAAICPCVRASVSSLMGRQGWTRGRKILPTLATGRLPSGLSSWPSSLSRWKEESGVVLEGRQVGVGPRTALGFTLSAIFPNGRVCHQLGWIWLETAELTKGRMSCGPLQLADKPPAGVGDGFCLTLALPHLLLALRSGRRDHDLLSGFWLILGC